MDLPIGQKEIIVLFTESALAHAWRGSAFILPLSCQFADFGVHLTLMAVPKDTLWPIEPHTQAKHEILRRYLSAWLPILSRSHDKIAFIDGFSGPGRYTGGEPGSPLVALDVAIHHLRALEGEIAFWFMDERQDRIDHLQQELANLTIPKHFRIAIECNRFAENLTEALDSIFQDGLRMAPTFALVDPFGFSGIPYSLIQ